MQGPACAAGRAQPSLHQRSLSTSSCLSPLNRLSTTTAHLQRPTPFSSSQCSVTAAPCSPASRYQRCACACACIAQQGNAAGPGPASASACSTASPLRRRHMECHMPWRSRGRGRVPHRVSCQAAKKMSGPRKVFVCSECGKEHPKLEGARAGCWAACVDGSKLECICIADSSSLVFPGGLCRVAVCTQRPIVIDIGICEPLVCTSMYASMCGVFPAAWAHGRCAYVCRPVPGLQGVGHPGGADAPAGVTRYGRRCR